MKLGCVLSVAVMVAMVSGNAAVLTNTITATGSRASPIDPFLKLEWKIETTAGDASIIGEFSDTGLIATTFTIGIEHNWYSVDEGTAFTPSYAAMATPFAPFLDIPGSDTLTPTFGEPFYLGVELGSEFEPETQRIGWVELLYDGIELTALSSATEDSGRGLIVGTQTVVPEPSVTSLAILALGSVFMRRRRSS